jgi:hypothetical protein
MRIFLTILITATALFSQAQNGNLKVSAADTSDVLTLEHSPRKATLLSAALPGAGQIYNKKLWKAPIVWGGLAGCIYAINYNTEIFKEVKADLIAEVDGDPLTINTSGFSASFLSSEVDRWARYRDISWMCLGAVYVLNILDAHVDAHLFYFDVNEDLSLHILPYTIFSFGNNTGLTLSLNF